MRLPRAFSTFILTLSLTTALPVNAVLTLTTDNFDKTVAQGYWFIEHFSPWCHHCREFKPTWEKLVNTVPTLDDLKHIKLAQVNCATHGDLCDSHGVTGYPQMNLYQDGKFFKAFSGAREMERLTDFLKTNAPKSPAPAVSAPPPPPPAASASPPPAPEQSPESKPEQPRSPPPRSRLNLEGQVQSLSEANFKSTLAQGPTFVKFFAPWCGHCKKLAPAWTQLAHYLKNKMNIVEVNCEDHGNLCSQEGVQGYPTLIYFQKGIKTEYNGGRKFEQLREFAEMVSAPPLRVIEPNQVEQHLDDNQVAFLLVQSKLDDRVVRAVEFSSLSLFGSAPVFSVVSPALLSQHHIDTSNSTLALRVADGGSNTDSSISSSSSSGTKGKGAQIKLITTDPFAILAFKSKTLTAWTTTTDKLDTFLMENALPAFLQLSQDSFSKVMSAPHRPLVVIAATAQDKKNQDKVSKKVEEIGKKWLLRNEGGDTPTTNNNNGKAKQVVFTWMDAGRWEKWLKKMYGVKLGDEIKTKVVIANHADLVYYDQDSGGKPLELSATKLFEVIDQVKEGKLAAKNSENMMERFARFTSKQLVRGESYVLSHPLQAIAFVMAGGAIIFWLLKRWLSIDDLDARERGHPHAHAHGKKRVARLD